MFVLKLADGQEEMSQRNPNGLQLKNCQETCPPHLHVKSQCNLLPHVQGLKVFIWQRISFSLHLPWGNNNLFYPSHKKWVLLLFQMHVDFWEIEKMKCLEKGLEWVLAVSKPI